MKTQDEILAIIEKYNAELIGEKRVLENSLVERVSDDIARRGIVSILYKRIAIIEIKQRILEKL